VSIKNFEDYCILGDDIVIANDKVAESYLEVMSTLGLEINRQKSVESERFSEFAKNLLGYEVDYTPLGPGLILQAIRSTSYSLRFMTELVSRNKMTLDRLIERVQNAPKFFRAKLGFSI
jgi:hypothetical protein